MELIGHRGCGAQSTYPENTVRAVEEASKHLPAIEVDVRRCGSGEVVVHHDEQVARSSGQINVGETDYGTLRGIELGPQGDSIPLLADIVDILPDSKILQVELKEEGLADDVFEIIDNGAVRSRISSFSTEALEEFISLGSDVPTGYLFRDEHEDNVAAAADLGCDIVHPHHTLCSETDVIRRARERGFRVIAWNTDDPSVVASMHEANVDGITVDRWDLADEIDEKVDGCR